MKQMVGRIVNALFCLCHLRMGKSKNMPEMFSPLSSLSFDDINYM